MSASKGTRPWNAGTSKGWVDKRGYRWVYITENGRRRARREHRVIMENHLGRRLEPWEVVHHKNGNTQDNSIKNLEVQEWGTHTVEHHSGARHSWESKRSMQVFAMLREEVNHLRRVNADLLEAVRLVLEQHGEIRGGPCPCIGCYHCRAAIAKAEGK